MWGNRPEDELPNYNEEIYWEPVNSDTADSELRKISSTTPIIIQDTFSCTLEAAKRKSIKRKQPIPDTLFTKVPKLIPTIQSRLPAVKTVNRGLGLQGYVLHAAILLINMLDSAKSGSLNPKDAAESGNKFKCLCPYFC